MIDRINFLLKYVLCVFSRRWHLFCHVYEVIFFFLFIFLSEAPHIICTALFFIFISSCYICSTVDAQQFVWLSHAIFTVCFFSVCIILLWYRKDKRFLYCTKKKRGKKWLIQKTWSKYALEEWAILIFHIHLEPFEMKTHFFMFLTRIFNLNRGFVSNIWHDTCECTGTPLSFCYLTWIGAWVKV